MKEQKAKLNEWVIWAIGEGVARTGSLTVSKAVGLSNPTFGGGILSTLVIGLVQMVGSIIVAKSQNYRLVLGLRYSLWCAFFGISGTIQTVILLLAFGAGADLTVYVFIVVALAIVPGALIDIVFFKEQFGLLGWAGIVMASIGGYAMFGFPSLGESFALPLWVYGALVAMLLFAGNQGASRILTTLETDRPHLEKSIAQNIVSGAVSLMSCALALLFLPSNAVREFFATPAFVGGSAVIGLFVICLVVANLMSYQRGAANIPIKKVVANGAFLFLSAFSGYVFFGDHLGWEKFLGIALYVAAFFLINAKNKKK